MPYVQGDSSSVTDEYATYKDIINEIFIEKGQIGYLTIDESFVAAGKAQRGAHGKYARKLHTEAGVCGKCKNCRWGGGGWGGHCTHVTLEAEVKILVSSNTDNSTAVWQAEHKNTTIDGDIGMLAAEYPYAKARMLRAGEVAKIGIFTPHESIPVKKDTYRQFLRIVSAGVHGREEYFTRNELMNA